MSEPFVLADRAAVYLASKSPRRQELLRQLGVEFVELRVREAAGREPDVVEAPREGEAPVEYVKRVTRLKASVAWHRMARRGLAPRPVLAADTEVILEGKVLGKPKNAADAMAMLGALSARTHEVVSAVAVRREAQLVQALSASRVTFRAVAKDEIERYVATGEPFDKAGAYAIQGRAAAFVQHLEGSYSGVMGLPLFETAEILTRIGYQVL